MSKKAKEFQRERKSTFRTLRDKNGKKKRKRKPQALMNTSDPVDSIDYLPSNDSTSLTQLPSVLFKFTPQDYAADNESRDLSD